MERERYSRRRSEERDDEDPRVVCAFRARPALKLLISRRAKEVGKTPSQLVEEIVTEFLIA